MNYHSSKGWGSLAFAALTLPLLMGAKGGCGGDVSMGSDLAGAAGSNGNQTGGKGNSPGSGGAIARGGAEATGGSIARGGADATGGAIARGGANSCDGFEDSTSSDEVTVRYVNDGAEPIYVGRTRPDECGSGSASHEFVLLNAAGEELGWTPEVCSTCASLQLDEVSCPTVCLSPPLVRIDPGASHDFKWTGTYIQMLEMPLECFGNKLLANGRCRKVVTAEAASYRVVGTAWSSFECPPDIACPCIPTDSGSCTFSPAFGKGSVATGTSRQVSAELAYPAEKLVELHFD